MSDRIHYCYKCDRRWHCAGCDTGSVEKLCDSCALPDMPQAVGGDWKITEPAPGLPGDSGNARAAETPDMFKCYGCLMEFPRLTAEQGEFCADCVRAMPAFARRV